MEGSQHNHDISAHIETSDVPVLRSRRARFIAVDEYRAENVDLGHQIVQETASVLS
jgi:hypothetical protein